MVQAICGQGAIREDVTRCDQALQSLIQSYGLQKYLNSTWVILTHTTMKGPFGSQIRVF